MNMVYYTYQYKENPKGASALEVFLFNIYI